MRRGDKVVPAPTIQQSTETRVQASNYLSAVGVKKGVPPVPNERKILDLSSLFRRIRGVPRASQASRLKGCLA